MEINEITRGIIGAAIQVHKRLGPGLLESAYRACLAYELRKQVFFIEEEKSIPIIYDDIKLDCGYRADMIVNDLVIVELKAKTVISPVDKVQLLSYLRLMELQFGLLINFYEVKLVEGVHRILNSQVPNLFNSCYVKAF